MGQTLKIATYDASLERRGPGLLLRDILSGDDAQINSVADIITHVAPDILLLTGFDYDNGNHALHAFADLLAARGTSYPHLFALRPNTGMETGLDMNRDGRTGTAADAQGYGEFAGQGGMAILSRYPIDTDRVQDFSALRWVDFPGALLPHRNGQPFPSPEALSLQRLSTTGHWVVPVRLPGSVLNLMAFAATPPVFDGPEDKNGKRNHGEIAFWNRYLNGQLAPAPLPGPFVILGKANLDPHDSEGRNAVLRDLLAHPKLQDPRPASQGARHASRLQGGANLSHQGDPALDTADWRDDPGPGNLRVDYVLPSADLMVTAAGVFWPGPDQAESALLGQGEALASHHHMVWVQLRLQR
ncbi:MAG: endonuclease [Rhodobacterales bacterium]|nr:MAG: endonuclease [Rhodobacterales bacterium]